MLSRLINKAAFIALALGVNYTVTAEEKLRISGFIGVGAAYVSDNNFLGENRHANEILDAGLQGYYELSNDFSVTGQITYRRLGDLMNDSRPRVDFAALNWSTRAVGETQISLGRVKPQLGLYNTSRDMPTSRPTVIMPQSLYSDFFRNLLLSFDGVRIGTNFDVIDGTISLEAAYGDTNLDENFNRVVVGDLSKGKWDGRSAFSFDARYIGNELTLAFSYNKLHPYFDAGDNSFLDVTGTGFLIPLNSGELGLDTYYLSFQYNTENIEYTAEALVRKNQLGGIVPLDKSQTEGYYGQIRYSFSSQITGTLRFENYYRNKDRQNGGTTPLSGVPSHANTAKTTTLGLTWQINPDWMIATDIHFVEGAGWLAPLTTTTAVAFGKKHWTLWATQAVYRF